MTFPGPAGISYAQALPTASRRPAVNVSQWPSDHSTHSYSSSDTSSDVEEELVTPPIAPARLNLASSDWLSFFLSVGFQLEKAYRYEELLISVPFDEEAAEDFLENAPYDPIAEEDVARFAHHMKRQFETGEYYARQLQAQRSSSHAARPPRVATPELEDVLPSLAFPIPRTYDEAYVTPSAPRSVSRKPSQKLNVEIQNKSRSDKRNPSISHQVSHGDTLRPPNVDQRPPQQRNDGTAAKVSGDEHGSRLKSRPSISNFFATGHLHPKPHPSGPDQPKHANMSTIAAGIRAASQLHERLNDVLADENAPIAPRTRVPETPKAHGHGHGPSQPRGDHSNYGYRTTPSSTSLQTPDQSAPFQVYGLNADYYRDYYNSNPAPPDPQSLVREMPRQFGVQPRNVPNIDVASSKKLVKTRDQPATAPRTVEVHRSTSTRERVRAAPVAAQVEEEDDGDNGSLDLPLRFPGVGFSFSPVSRSFPPSVGNSLDPFISMSDSQGVLSYSVEKLCQHIRTKQSSATARILSFTRLKATQGVKHEFLILKARMQEGVDVFVRLDRAAKQNYSKFRFHMLSSQFPANDSAVVGGTEELLLDPQCPSEVVARVDFPQRAPSLSVLEKLLSIVCHESPEYKLVSENCWFFSSILQQIFCERFGGRLVHGDLHHKELGGKTRGRILDMARQVQYS